MSYPKSSDIEFPLLQELTSVGGSENVRFLYEKLIPYFPALSESEIVGIRNSNDKKWRKLVQEAGKSLSETGFLNRSQGFWQITGAGRNHIEAASEEFVISAADDRELNHSVIQQMLVEIGETLNYFAEKEFEYYDVVWRNSAKSPRISHVFEVQSKGNIDSALTKLKRAYETQRSKPFLVLSSERDLNRAKRETSREKIGAFYELSDVLTILSFAEIRKTHQALIDTAEILPKFLTD